MGIVRSMFRSTVYEQPMERIYDEKHYISHNNNILWDDVVVKHSDAKSFIDLGDGYGRDKHFIFFRGVKIKYIDIDTFKINTNYYASDNQHYYFQGQIIRPTQIPCLCGKKKCISPPPI